MIEAHYWQAIIDGKFTLGYDLAWPWLIAIALLLIAVAGAFYWRTTRPVSRLWKGFFIGLRATTLILIAFLLLEPGVLVSDVTPQETYLAVLIDDSQSMSIRDQAELPTRQQQTENLLFKNERVIERLSEKFQVRTYRFSRFAERAASVSSLTASGDQSAIADSLEQVINEIGSFPMAGVVLVTDGADNSARDPMELSALLKEKQIPLYTVGVGAENISKDVNIAKVVAAKSLLEDSVYSVDVAVAQQGYAGQSARIKISTNNVEIASKTVRFAEDGASKRFTLDINPAVPEILIYNLSIDEMPGETILQNNHISFLVDNREKPPLDVLYLEGQPRNEYKFIRRAIHDDRSQRLATYLQTGPRKFLRQGIRSAEELSDGFPTTKEALYEYEAVLLGNVERNFFSDKQLQLLQEFVAERGGGFMLLGGLQESFIDSPVAAMLPVELARESHLPNYLQGGSRRGDHPTGQTFPVKLTKDGEYSPILRLSSDDGKNRELWRAMPMLEGIYVSGQAKPGATVLIEHPALNFQSAPLPVLTAQRYGAGRSMALATASTWRWQMLLPHEDQSHERLWRQMLRWLTSHAPQRLTLSLDAESYHPGDQVSVTAQLLDNRYEPSNDALLWLEITDPQQATTEIPLSWQLEKEGAYRAAFIAPDNGVYALKVKVPSELTSDISAQLPVLVTPSRREYLNAGMDSGLLKRMASMTGGEFYNIADAGKLVDAITFSPNAHSLQEVHSLWDQPLFLLLILLLVSIEWMARRLKGLT